MNKFNPKDFEDKWRKKWATEETYKTPEIKKGDEKFYSLYSYPYPSGAGLHVGHVEGMVANDIPARYNRMLGKKVMMPMGWDSFGLPAENYAIKTGIHPKDNTDEAIKAFIEQINNIGISVDWNTEVGAHYENYYKWTQWIFIQLFNAGLAYKKKAPVNWCPKDQTVLANEQVESDGTCERCGTEVEQKDLEQWFFKITDFADRLVDDLDKVDWPDSTKAQQRDWIGRSIGAEILWKLNNPDYKNKKENQKYIVELANTDDAEEISFIRVSGWLENNINEKTGVTKEFLGEFHDQKIPISKDKIQKQSNYIKENPESNLIIRENGKILGWLGLMFEEDNVISFGVYVHPDHRGRGVGSALMNYVFEKNPSHKFKIEVSKNNTRAIELYKRQGFEEVGESKWFIEGREENFIPLYVMEKECFVIHTFTTRFDTIPGPTFLVIAPEYEHLDKIVTAENKDAVSKYIDSIKNKTDLDRQTAKEKTGVFTGSYAVNPFNNEEIPIYVADYVLANYGTGAVMGMPGHDQRDYDFAKKFDLPIKYTLQPKDEGFEFPKDKAFEGEGYQINSGEFNGLWWEEAKDKIMDKLISEDKAIKKVNYRLRDWLLSRQRYWGCPIPVIYDPEGNAHAVPEEDLPVLLPYNVDFSPTGESPLAKSEEFQKSAEEKYGKGWRREVDTMDTFVDSSWYFFRHVDAKNDEKIFDSEKVNAWLPTDLYMIGAEHIVLHLMYSRFFTKFFFDQGLIDFDEPFYRMRHMGLILGPDGRKMSKRWGNVINPNDEIDKYGADTLRIYEMFMGPLIDAKPWNDSAEKGVLRFLSKVWDNFNRIQTTDSREEVKFEIRNSKFEIQEREINKLIKYVGPAIDTLSFNTAVAKMMEFNNFLTKEKEINKSVFERFMLVLAPFAPYVTEEIWSQMGNEFSIHNAKWPEFDESLTKESSVTIAIQINGKVRGTVEVDAGSNEDVVYSAAMKEQNIAKYVENEPKKKIYIQDRILNIIV
ncbi:leucine--tRNA ligase [Candidatus Dojkabacteria bacterium]|uniref:Leucine--tRNA ligase n=1 Tax=Candidatus Dojkabacteria bacterium TaxID=2099670 RepID=A0A955RM68_9BACT|nr:leucine--tRNA ligase [Candidatus Dojkabacteria bacterium]